MAYPTGQLYVDLRSIAENWRYMRDQTHPNAQCGAVVKANAYGLGVERIAPKVYQAGCRHFFVANFKEGMQLQALVGRDAKIYVLNGCIQGVEPTFIERGLIPVLVSAEMVARWISAASQAEQELPEAVLKVNSGMGRMGLEPDEFYGLLKDPQSLRTANITMVMSHLACADEPSHPLNKKQHAVFNEMLSAIREVLPEVTGSLANSAAVFLGDSLHYDLVRPGIALYGGNPGPDHNPMKPVVGLTLPIIQTRVLGPDEYVGYGATMKTQKECRIAVVAGGYADGLFRSLGNCGHGWFNGVKVPIVGRISMDSTMFDITDVPEVEKIQAGQGIELLGEHVTIDELADAAGTISYEILTSFGARYQRCYVG